ncbi:unnamed protein product [Acanthoscelides obtectus]|nr:unnamed protein product [Acanthoscelides obtectus]CAK1678541.1 Zinc finger protein 142 [Acanthoscelides obtectus]
MDTSEEKPVVIKIENTELEEYMDTAEFVNPSKLAAELQIKSEHDHCMEGASNPALSSILENKCQRNFKGQKKRISYSCFFCQFTVHSKNKLKEHLRAHQCYTCSKCFKTFRKKVSFDNHILKKHLSLRGLINATIHSCPRCPFKTREYHTLSAHMRVKHSEVGTNSLACAHCNVVFPRKRPLDEHMLRKHPEYIKSVTSKIHECTLCSYKTTKKYDFNRHQLTHPETSDLYVAPRICIHCEAQFGTTYLLECHIVKKHPDFSATVTCKVYECTKCSYKTARQSCYATHLLKHPETRSSNILSTCRHCNETFSDKLTLDNHILRVHPEFISEVTSRMFECTQCPYKTTRKSSFDTHKLTHPETANSAMLKACSYCDAKFKGKQALDSHVIRKHPDFGASITRKVYNCNYCSYRAIKKLDFARHIKKAHPEKAPSLEVTHNVKPRALTGPRVQCVFCNGKFADKMSVDDHVLRRHPEFASTITSLIHECTECNYKTTRKGSLTLHVPTHSRYECDKCEFRTTTQERLAKHSALHLQKDGYRHKTCPLCNSVFKSKRALDNHTIKKHPENINSVTSTVYQCSECSYQATTKNAVNIHFRSHVDKASRGTLQCPHCNVAPFTEQMSFDNHILKRHPNFISTIKSKIYECTQCGFKTVRKRNLTSHMVKHSEVSQ